VSAQMDFFRSQGERAAEACAEKAGIDLDAARAVALDLLGRYGELPGEKLVAMLKRHGFRGHDDRCFGPVFSVLAKRKQIRCVGFCTRERGHGTAGGRIWALV
jgi:hypothetical protein